MPGDPLPDRPLGPEEVARFTAGAVGPPGQRLFLLELDAAGGRLVLKVEKQQVAALAQHLARLLVDLPEPEGLPPDAALALGGPPEPAWVVGTIGVGYDEADDRLVVLLAEFDEDAQPGEPADADGEEVRVRLTRDQAAGFVKRVAELLAAGRPTCPLCGGPMDPEGHVCPRTNGHRTR